MTDHYEQLEREVHRELQLLEKLPDVRPAPALVRRIQAEVQAAARSRPTTVRIWRQLTGLAAAIALAVVWQLPATPSALPPLGETAASDELVDAWLDAAADSSLRLAALVEEPWLPGSEPRDADDLFDDYVEELDASIGLDT